MEKATIEPESDDEFQYDAVPVDEEYAVSGNEVDENYDTVMNIIHEKESVAVIEDAFSASSVAWRIRPEVVEDYVRNFLVRMNMLRTLDTFQTEWYEFKDKGLLKEEDSSNVPDVYMRNQQLDELANNLRKELNKFKGNSQKALEMHVKLRKERDFYRVHHKRVVQEKERLISEIKRLKKHYESYEPALNALRKKYEIAMKEKMLTKLERDRAVSQIEGIQAVTKVGTFNYSQEKQIDDMILSNKTSESSNQTSSTKHPKDSEFPADKGVNPRLSVQRLSCPHLTRSGGFRMTSTINAHSLGVSGFALHPRKQLMATVSDDRTWSLWSLPDGEKVMSGEGHDDWLSDCDFNPVGTQLVTVSGDATLKIWDFSKERCVHSFLDHTHAIWGCTWHWAGDFIASCAMDGVSKIWDLNSFRCRSTLRGHGDSVNSINFVPYSNTLCTCSADRTVSLWDARTALCETTFYGHIHSVNHATFNQQGELIASGDAYGILNLWDVRNACIVSTIDLGPHSINKVAFDPGSNVVTCASNDGLVKLYEIESGNVTVLTGHEDAVQAVIFDRNGEYLLSCSSDATVKIWS